MAAKAIQMEQLKQILQLKRDGLSIKAIARYTGIARNTIRKYLARIDCTDNATKVEDKELSQAVSLLAGCSSLELLLSTRGLHRQALPTSRDKL